MDDEQHARAERAITNLLTRWLEDNRIKLPDGDAARAANLILMVIENIQHGD